MSVKDDQLEWAKTINGSVTLLAERLKQHDAALKQVHEEMKALSNRIESLYTFVSSLNRPTVVP